MQASDSEVMCKIAQSVLLLWWLKTEEWSCFSSFMLLSPSRQKRTMKLETMTGFHIVCCMFFFFFFNDSFIKVGADIAEMSRKSQKSRHNGDDGKNLSQEAVKTVGLMRERMAYLGYTLSIDTWFKKPVFIF